MTDLRCTLVLVVTVAGAVLLPEPAYAYGGPGSIISGIGAFLAALAAVVAAVFGFVWFPLKRLYRKLRREDRNEEAAELS